MRPRIEGASPNPPQERPPQERHLAAVTGDHLETKTASREYLMDWMDARRNDHLQLMRGKEATNIYRPAAAQHAGALV